ncbi:MAG: hypothetical protein A2W91_00800 [Bacteroidetes bacterium GWF2_38_335]|nr:MAG: hypothetical protein A2W91_00800 [Bacteroidetes bacterium GWF2_38_335]OFY78371.1 MAG: hypothetical protein A2281_04180 [Bacteroidetes bacterium RIFOXYA12_FULL_38_20]HBS87432.1 hypothetical protein [Bacteroidales bacterium]
MQWLEDGSLPQVETCGNDWATPSELVDARWDKGTLKQGTTKNSGGVVCFKNKSFVFYEKDID